jgi:hypothetical protein
MWRPAGIRRMTAIELRKSGREQESAFGFFFIPDSFVSLFMKFSPFLREAVFIPLCGSGVVNTAYITEDPKAWTVTTQNGRRIYKNIRRFINF